MVPLNCVVVWFGESSCDLSALNAAQFCAQAEKFNVHRMISVAAGALTAPGLT